MRSYLAGLLFLSILTGTAAGQSKKAEADRLLGEAEKAYRIADYKGAETQLLRLLRLSGQSKESEKAAVMLTDVLLRLKQHGKAELLISRFRQYYLSSTHTARMLYYEGLVRLQKGDYASAARAFVQSADKTETLSLFENNERALRHLIDGRGLKSEELQQALQLAERSAAMTSLLLEALGDEYYRSGRFRAAHSAYQDWLSQFPRSARVAEVRDKLKKSSATQSQVKTILVMAPFSGEFGDIGKVLNEGAQLAIEEYNKQPGSGFRGLLLDTHGNPITAVTKLRKILREEDIDAIVGPAMSDVSTAVAIELSSRGSKIPMVTPTATTYGIADLGDGIFQFNVTTEILGRAVSAYALECLGLKDYAILAPNTEYGYQLSEAFRSNVDKSGGLVLAHEYYNPEDTDLAGYFEKIRTQVARVKLERERFEKGYTNESAGAALKKSVADSVLEVQGLFLPAGNGEDAYKLASQASYNKLRAQILGSSGWNDKMLLHKPSPVVQGAVFSVDFPENPSGESWKSFRRNYQTRWGKAPDKVGALGYDATRFLLEGLNSSPGKDGLISTLRGVRSFAGVQGLVLFGEGKGANQNTALYRVERKGFKEISGCVEAR